MSINVLECPIEKIILLECKKYEITSDQTGLHSFPCLVFVYLKGFESLARNLNARKNGIGEPSSKYGYDRDGSQFEADVQQHLEESERLYQEFVDWVKERRVNPETVRRMFIAFYYEFIE